MALPGKHNKPWTNQEIGQLKEMYRKKILHRDIASKLKRTLNAIESKAIELGISGRRKARRAVR
jgi:hypothetical protein